MIKSALIFFFKSIINLSLKLFLFSKNWKPHPLNSRMRFNIMSVSLFLKRVKKNSEISYLERKYRCCRQNNRTRRHNLRFRLSILCSFRCSLYCWCISLQKQQNKGPVKINRVPTLGFEKNWPEENFSPPPLFF